MVDGIWLTLVMGGMTIGVLSWTFWHSMSHRRLTRAERRRFLEQYGGSVDRLLAEAQIDRGEVRRLRDQPRGMPAATRYVRKALQVPPERAEEFARRV